jgi:type I restriction enzyme S subunit
VTAGVGPYAATKDSGLPWLGQIPAHWDLRRAKFLFHPVDIRSETGTEELLTVSSKYGVVPRASTAVTMFQAESYVGHKLCWPGDLVINSLWAWGGGLGVTRRHGIVSTAYGVYRLRPAFEGWSGYFHELLRSQPFQWELQVRSKGIWISRLQLTDEAFLAAVLPIPPPEDRDAIVRFLYYANRRIRRVTDTKHKLIALLKEQKQAVTHRVVTRGLDSSVPLKSSGLDGVGDIPAHWEIKRLKAICAMKSGDGITSEKIEAAGTYPVYGGNGIRGYSEDFTHSGDYVLVGRQGALCGNVHVATGEFWASEHAVVASPDALHDVDWLAALLTSMNLNQYSVAAAQPGLAVERILNLRVPLPPPTEQRDISAHLSQENATLDAAVRAAEQEVHLLREYRTRLIADVVTGKLDVREAVAGLPDESDEPELFDEIQVEETDDSETEGLEAEAVEA